MGRKVRPQFVKGGGVFPYLVQEIKESTISLRSRLSGVKDKLPMLDNGENHCNFYNYLVHRSQSKFFLDKRVCDR